MSLGDVTYLFWKKSPRHLFVPKKLPESIFFNEMNAIDAEKREESKNAFKNSEKKTEIILAKCPNTVWVLHREKVVLGVTLLCYVVLGSRVVLCCVARSELR